MSTTSPEIVRWKYHARELQTTAILNETENGIDTEVAANAEQFKRLDALLCTPPALLDLVIKNFHESRGQFYAEATTAARIFLRRIRTLDVLINFRRLKVCGFLLKFSSLRENLSSNYSTMCGSLKALLVLTPL